MICFACDRRHGVLCSACCERPATSSTGPTWFLCDECRAESDAYDDAHGLERSPCGPLPEG